MLKRLEFNDFEDFACEVADTYDAIREDDDLNDVAIIAKYEEARQIIQELICIGYTIQDIDIKSPEWGYEDEYVISLCNVDEGDIWCNPIIRDNGNYIEDNSVVIYVLDNCSSKVLKYLYGKCMYEVSIGDDECECDEGECACCKDEQYNTSTIPSATYKVNDKEVTKEEFDKKCAEFEDKYLDNVRDMLLSYCEFMDEMDEWRRLFRW